MKNFKEIHTIINTKFMHESLSSYSLIKELRCINDVIYHNKDNFVSVDLFTTDTEYLDEDELLKFNEYEDVLNLHYNILITNDGDSVLYKFMLHAYDSHEDSCLELTYIGYETSSIAIADYLYCKLDYTTSKDMFDFVYRMIRSYNGVALIRRTHELNFTILDGISDSKTYINTFQNLKSNLKSKRFIS